jgi:hypothetical protein
MFKAMMGFQWKAMLAKLMPDRPKKEYVKPTGRKSRKWQFSVDSRVVKIDALTRSEARARLKTILGVKRLPVGCTIHDEPPQRKVAA